MNTTALQFERPDRLQATQPPETRGLARDAVRLLVSTPRGHEHARFRDLSHFLDAGTLLVVNRSGTVPASVPARQERLGPFTVHLSTHYGRGGWLIEPRWSPGHPGPLPLTAGDLLKIAGLDARLIASHPGLPRLWFTHIAGNVQSAMHRTGLPIRYDYLDAPYPPLSAYQTLFAQAPGSAEMPSAGRPFSHRVLRTLQAKGVARTEITLHTGVSSHEVETDRIEDHVLYAEPFAVSPSAAAAVNAARREGRPVIAVGTTVVRALESAWDGNAVRPMKGFTRRFIHPGRPVGTVDGLITGLHDPRASHLALLYALAEPGLVQAAYREAVRADYRWHEFGDSHLLLPHAA